MDANRITQDVLDAAMKLHKQFGPGLLESVYEQLLTIELTRRGHVVESQKPVSFEYEGVQVENAFRMDLLVDGQVVVELKSTEQMNPVYAKQVKTYLALTGLQVGLLVNFGMNYLKDGFVRIVNHYQGPLPSASPLSHSPPLRASASPRDFKNPPLLLPLRASAPPREAKISSSLRPSALPREPKKDSP